MKLSPQAFELIMALLENSLGGAQVRNDNPAIEEIESIIQEVEAIGTY